MREDIVSATKHLGTATERNAVTLLEMQEDKISLTLRNSTEHKHNLNSLHHVVMDISVA